MVPNVTEATSGLETPIPCRREAVVRFFNCKTSYNVTKEAPIIKFSNISDSRFKNLPALEKILLAYS
jgi:hypothetical protein